MWAGWLRPLACFVSSISGQSILVCADKSDALEDITSHNKRMLTIFIASLEQDQRLACLQS